MKRRLWKSTIFHRALRNGRTSPSALVTSSCMRRFFSSHLRTTIPGRSTRRIPRAHRQDYVAYKSFFHAYGTILLWQGLCLARRFFEKKIVESFDSRGWNAKIKEVLQFFSFGNKTSTGCSACDRQALTVASACYRQSASAAPLKDKQENAWKISGDLQ